VLGSEVDRRRQILGMIGVHHLQHGLAQARLGGRPGKRPPRVGRGINANDDPAHPVHLLDRTRMPGTPWLAVVDQYPRTQVWGRGWLRMLTGWHTQPNDSGHMVVQAGSWRLVQKTGGRTHGASGIDP
jgi:hypothetical protein